MGVSLRCPECREKFPWDVKQKWPRFCPLCRADINNDRDDDDIVMPFISTREKRGTADEVYRQMEAGSEIRAQVAAEMAGCSADEMSGLKITNLNDRADSEIGHVMIPTDNDVGAMMHQNQNLGFSPMGLGFSDAVQHGANNNAGLRTQHMIRSTHSSVVGEACIGVDADTHRPVRPNTNVVFDNPAREVVQPGYKRRL